MTLDKLSIVLLFFQLHRELLLVKIDIPIYCITVENQQTHWWRLLVEDMSEAWSTTRWKGSSLYTGSGISVRSWKPVFTENRKRLLFFLHCFLIALSLSLFFFQFSPLDHCLLICLKSTFELLCHTYLHIYWMLQISREQYGWPKHTWQHSMADQSFLHRIWLCQACVSTKNNCNTNSTLDCFMVWVKSIITNLDETFVLNTLILIKIWTFSCF